MLLPLSLFLLLFPAGALSSCSGGCSLAVASYYLSPNLNLTLTYIATLFNLPSASSLLTPFNNLTSADVIFAGTRLNVTFPCDCLGGGSFLGQTFAYRTVKSDTYSLVASQRYADLTTADFLAFQNSYAAERIPTGVDLNVTVNCSCGDRAVSEDYGLFETYPLREGETLASVAKAYGVPQNLLEGYNPGVNVSSEKGILFVPTKDQTGSYRPLNSRTGGISGGAIAGISVAVIIFLLGLVISVYFGVYKRKKARTSLLPSASDDRAILRSHDMDSVPSNGLELTPQAGNVSAPAGFTVDKSVEFSYEELSKATNDFSMANKIGEGGFGAVYYAELRGERAAIKKMDMQASREFLAELKVLTHVHHLNLVRLIGYCTERSLFVVYEFIDNGNLSQHLRGSDWDPLEWSSRVQIALDSARGLEYIHEHTVPVYIHRDIKSANILIDKKFRAKVADFGLTKLTQAGGMTQPTRLVGTFGYMSPEYAQYGDVSPKIDVYAFGVVLFELISAKEAIIKEESVPESTGLVALFEGALNQTDPKESVRKLVDPRLGENFPIDSVHKLALLAKACTQENPQLRPSMRSIVVALMTLSSTTEDWDLGSFYENQAMVNLASGR
ncbi:lysM domain receptor-like kinase 3 [Iris pallida]|uniref:non-specific serine/threonine protein kinase n=1 Tax=Iris pallida TaxID=29817 RepID=A0AAX6ETH5_IRIPA|nr:lysM domain receptor-like kinase 3 [Iris pallida]KAJ6837506.1 lysM domain receptor-like kinase 3 [Iris pallida]